MKPFTIFAALCSATLFATISFAQIPITTVPAGPPFAPQPQLVPCTPPVNTLLGTNWAFEDNGFNSGFRFIPLPPGNFDESSELDERQFFFGAVSQIGTFTVGPSTGRGGLSVTGIITTNRDGGFLQRRAPFTGTITTLCFAGTNIAAAGTLQIGEGLSGTIFTWSYPITATIDAARKVTYAVSSVTTMNLERSGALDPVGRFTNTTNGYGYDEIYATSGIASQLVGQLACPAAANSVLDTLAPNGFSVSLPSNSLVPNPRTKLVFKGSGTDPATGTVTGNVMDPLSFGPQPEETGKYQVYQNCTGFVMSIPLVVNGRIFGAEFEGVFAAGDFSKAFLLPGNTPFTNINFGLIRN